LENKITRRGSQGACRKVTLTLTVVGWWGDGHLHKEFPEEGNTFPPQHAATASWQKGRKPIPLIIGAADTRRRRCRKGSHRAHPRLQLEGCSPQTSPHQVCPSRWRSEAAESNISGLRHAKWQWQVQPQWNRGSLCPYTKTNNIQRGSRLGLQM
jgi:hypothetical protein